MPRASALERVPAWAMAGACGLVGAAISLPFWQHLGTLGSHLASGSWEITSDNVALEKRIELEYGSQRPKIAVSRVAGTALKLPVTEEYRSATIDRVARVSLADQPGLSFNGTPLEVSYNELLRMLEDQAARATTPLPRGTAKMLTDARFAYNSAKTRLGVDFPPFAVTTNPIFDRDGAWRRQTVRLEQKGRCTGEVAQLGGKDAAVAADIRTFPTALEVTIERPWLSEPLLDWASRQRDPAVRRFFSAADPTGGGLRLIPQTMWILQTDAIEARVNAEGKEKISAWVNDNACCKITCQDRFNGVRPDGDTDPESEFAAFTLEPNSLRWKDKTAHGLLTSPKQQLFALTSKRRGN